MKEKILDSWRLCTRSSTRLDRIKKIIDIEKFVNTKILIDTDDILPDVITLKNAVVLLTSDIQDGNKFYPQLLLEEALYYV